MMERETEIEFLHNLWTMCMNYVGEQYSWTLLQEREEENE